MTVVSVLLTLASVSMQAWIFLTHRRSTPAEDGESNRSEMRPSVSQ